MRTVNLGILAHVDAGKTTLTERLLYAAGVIGEIGSVDDGSTQTDTLALERQRGITIKSAVVSFRIGDVAVNLIDTPGHPDFIAEVERVLSVLDGAVLVVSAVEGVQAQTRVLMRTLQRLRIPTLLFLNKIDRAGADTGRVLGEIAAKLTPDIIAMSYVHGAGTRGARVSPHPAGDAGFAGRLTDLLARHDDALLAAYLAGETALSWRRLRRALAAQTGRAAVHPVFAGSAMTGAGVPDLTGGIAALLPAARGSAAGPVSGTVFKIERGPAGEKAAYVRVFTGTLRVRDRVRYGPDGEGRITALGLLRPGGAAPAGSAAAGQIAVLRGLGGIQVGDPVGAPGTAARQRHFAPPTLETVVVPARAAGKGALHAALSQLAEQDPLINLRQDDLRGELYLSLYGEVQKEVIEATLASDFGIGVSFRETTAICAERITGAGEAAEQLDTPGNPFLAGVGLRVEAAPPGTGVDFRLGIEPGSLPVPFRKAVEETVRQTLAQGLRGWPVPDAVVTLTRSQYIPPQGRRGVAFDPRISSTAGDFRSLTPLVLMSALRQAGTVVCEPVHRFTLEIPADTLASVLPVLAAHRAVPRGQEPRAAAFVLTGEIPAAQAHGLQQRLPGLTRGEAVLECGFSHYQPVAGPPPRRPRTGPDPLDRKEYLLRVMRRV
jgi:ribosomal protection tetracycline resistance protein